MLGESAVPNHTTWIVPVSIPVFGDADRNNVLWKRSKPWTWEGRRVAVPSFLQFEFSAL